VPSIVPDAYHARFTTIARQRKRSVESRADRASFGLFSIGSEPLKSRGRKAVWVRSPPPAMI
jgi:hypothetical protein